MVLHDLPSLHFVGVPCLVSSFFQDTRLDTQRAVGYKSRQLSVGEDRRDSQGNFKFVCLSMNLRITVLCGARHAVHGQNPQVDWNSVLRGTAGGHHHVSCI